MTVRFAISKRVRTTGSLVLGGCVLSMLVQTSSAFCIGKRMFSTRRPGVETVALSKNDNDSSNSDKSVATNVLGTSLSCCCNNVGGSGVGTGFYRNGFCETGQQDLGRHTVCCQVTAEFLEYSKSVGNDLSTPVPQYAFPGLKDGDVWCVCAQRWAQAHKANKAPKVFLKATHEKTLDYVSFETLREYAIDQDEADQALDDLNAQRQKLNDLL